MVEVGVHTEFKGQAAGLAGAHVGSQTLKSIVEIGDRHSGIEPRTLNAIVMPLTGCAPTLATLAIEGGWLTATSDFRNHGVAVG